MVSADFVQKYKRTNKRYELPCVKSDYKTLNPADVNKSNPLLSELATYYLLEGCEVTQSSPMEEKQRTGSLTG